MSGGVEEVVAAPAPAAALVGQRPLDRETEKAKARKRARDLGQMHARGGGGDMAEGCREGRGCACAGGRFVGQRSLAGGRAKERSVVRRIARSGETALGQARSSAMWVSCHESARDTPTGWGGKISLGRARFGFHAGKRTRAGGADNTGGDKGEGRGGGEGGRREAEGGKRGLIGPHAPSALPLISALGERAEGQCVALEQYSRRLLNTCIATAPACGPRRRAGMRTPLQPGRAAAKIEEQSGDMGVCGGVKRASSPAWHESICIFFI